MNTFVNIVLVGSTNVMTVSQKENMLTEEMEIGEIIIMDNRFYIYLSCMLGFLLGSICTMLIISIEHQLF